MFNLNQTSSHLVKVPQLLKLNRVIIQTLISCLFNEEDLIVLIVFFHDKPIMCLEDEKEINCQ